MDREELEQFLHECIPLSKAIGIEVQEATIERVILAAPLTPNINHWATVFGGSASAVAILAAWALLYMRLRQAGLNSRLVIQKNTMTYDRPIADKFVATSSIDNPSDWQKFQEVFKRKKRARISVAVTLRCNGEKVGQMLGDFVALAVPAV
jgi:thioesterase domain-containing protein